MHTSAMHDSPSEGGRSRRVVLTTLAVLALLGVVALASHGGAPLGSGATRRPSQQLLDYAISIFVTLMGLGALLFVLVLLVGRDAMREVALQRKRRNTLHGVAVFALAMILLALLVRGLHDSGRAVPRLLPRPATTVTSTTAKDGGQGERYQPRFTLVPVLIVAALAVGGGVALLAAARARRRAFGEPDDGALAEAIGDVLDETLDDLRAEADPRRAVIKAYARLERTLAAYGLPRRPSEAPHEYLERMLTDLAVSTRAVGRLTTLYERAKFSQHAVGPAMKEDAIGALESVRDELRAAALQAERERAAALEAARERAAL